MLLLNCSGFDLDKDHMYRLVDSYFYDSEDNRLKVRHVKWLDLFPCEHQFDVDKDHDRIRFRFFPDPKIQAALDTRVKFRSAPDFQIDKLRQLNRFVELFCSNELTSETELTRFLAEEDNQFIVKMAFFCQKLYPERRCEWAEPGRPAIKPDFFGEQPNGYSDLVEFKLPDFGGAMVTGPINRETFSAKLTAYVSQTRVYEEYFEDPRNREHAETKWGIKVRYPKRYLVVGRRWMFPTEDWRKIQNDFRNLTVVTYDDLVDGVRSQLYS